MWKELYPIFDKILNGMGYTGILITGGIQFIIVNVLFLAISGLVYELFFAWWFGIVGQILYVLLVFIVSLVSFFGFIGQPIADLRNQIKSDNEKRESTARTKAEYDALPHSRIEKFVNNEPKKSKQILQGIANSVGSTYSQTKNAPLYQPMSLTIHPIVKWVNNEDRLKIVEQELKDIQNYQVLDSINNTRNAFMTMQTDSIDGVPLAPIKEVLAQNGVSFEKVGEIHQQFQSYQQRHQEAIAYLEKEVAIMSTGIGGENRTHEELAMYEGIWKFVPNVRFEVDGQSVESDFLLLSTRGIYTIEVKNYSPKGNYAIHITKDGQWRKVYPNGNTEPMNNVTAQMNRHIALKQKLFIRKWKEKYGEASVPFIFKPIFVIANDTIRIQNETDLPIMRISNIYHHVMNQPEILTQEQVEGLCNIIEENNLPPKKYELNSYLPGLKKTYLELKKKEATISSFTSLINRYVHEAEKELLQHLNIVLNDNESINLENIKDDKENPFIVR